MISRMLSFVTISILITISLMFWGVEKQIANASTLTSASKYTLSINGKKVNANVQVIKGRSYVPLRAITNKLGYTISYALVDELDLYQYYEIDGASKRVTIWGNKNRGYSIIKRIGKEYSPDDIQIYDAKIKCVSETDLCELIKDIYEGPFVKNNTLYVPIRYMADAFSLNLTISNNIIHITK
ncbi:stalk domain-containing protein [Heyndrickxia oleronia]|uniref:stalk domain-containing protein n=1 Tax=Heyndrickxia oleronia TaxID=38875 RepID=UPI00242FBAFA|nr:stalk domain-containing protein [Heyndrickxia oleronia]MCI1591869.1 copper amine oxidase N-terminal domain-containing protein [Heyndrickxia oleronia]MCI1614526.1 copper amine oxidase N-terminal domain-containing protein [Heyndrickxia oleronia]MCI1743359.1 copper amine oxidase N-terminal domain-containing protein [Heyndrickxia oleronia]MCI1762366.1 copper amine oxidase N-terminal domain-containing protein [Heyndrickxia oleronia]